MSWKPSVKPPLSQGDWSYSVTWYTLTEHMSGANHRAQVTSLSVVVVGGGGGGVRSFFCCVLCFIHLNC